MGLEIAWKLAPHWLDLCIFFFFWYISSVASHFKNSWKVGKLFFEYYTCICQQALFTAGLYLSHLKRGQTVCIIIETKEERNVCGCLKFLVAKLPAKKAWDACSPVWEAARKVSMVEIGPKIVDTFINLHLWLYIFSLNMCIIVTLIMLISIVVVTLF